MDTTERWERLPAEFGAYDVSDGGSVRNEAGRVLRPWTLSTGYAQVMLANRKKHSVHRLVALMFCAGHADGLVVNHKNGNKTDNRAENLEWITSGENIRHGYRVLGATGLKGRFGSDSNKHRAVRAEHIKTGEVLTFGSGMDAVRAGFRSDGISRACHGKIEHHAGYRWSFTDAATALAVE